MPSINEVDVSGYSTPTQDSPAPAASTSTRSAGPSPSNEVDVSGYSTVPPVAPAQPSKELVGTVAVPNAGRIPGIMSSGNKVTPGQAAAGLAAGAVIGSPALIPEAISAGAGIGRIATAAAKNPIVKGVSQGVGFGTITHPGTAWDKAVNAVEAVPAAATQAYQGFMDWLKAQQNAGK